jgi:acyl-CoA synthetase (AMP-forming)/AMP-acid ligase II
MPAMTDRTFQEVVGSLALPQYAGAGRGLRFSYAREVATAAGVRLTWGDVAQRVDALAQRIAAVGIGADDLVIVHSHDQQTAFVCMLACIRLGVAVSAVAPVAAGTAERLVLQLANIVRSAKPALIVLDRQLDAEHRHVLGEVPTLLVEKLEASTTPPTPIRIAAADDCCFVQFTSGSTSTPKGVVVTHRMLLANLAAIGAVIGMDGDGRIVGWLPIYHDMSLVGLYLQTVYHRAFACFYPTSRFGRSPDSFLQYLAEERAHFSGAPNFAYAMINRHARRRPPIGIDLGCVRGIICGSEPISAEVLREFAAIHAPLGLRNAVIPAFGMAECTLMATAARMGEAPVTLCIDRTALESRSEVVVVAPGHHGAVAELVGCGEPALGMAIAILGPHDGELPEDRVGEVVLSGESVLSRYFREGAARPDAYATVRGARFFRTGDNGFLHRGALYICGRAKDVIIHNGVNFYPADLEQALERELPDVVRLAAVVDLRAHIGEEFTGIGVLFEDAARGADASARERVRDFAKDFSGLPVAIALGLGGGEHIPRTTSGKLVRVEVRSRLLAALAANGSAIRDGLG